MVQSQFIGNIGWNLLRAPRSRAATAKLQYV